MAAPTPLREIIKRKYFPSFDGIRAVAMVSVLMAHANYPISGVPGDLGVIAFFVMSGFLITRLILREYDDTGSVSLKAFYARRTLRIFPAYYAFVIGSLVIDYFKHQHWSPALIVSGFGYGMNYYNAFNNHPNTPLAHAWSLGVEEQFYLLWPLVFLLLMRRGKEAVVKGLIVASVASLAWRSWLFLYAHSGTAYVHNSFDCRFDNLAIGCLLAIVIGRPRVLAIGEAIARRAWYPLITLAVLLGVHHYRSDAFHYSVGFTVYALLLAVFFVQLVQLHSTRAWAWIEYPAVRYVGSISYPMYLWHAWAESAGRHLPSHSPHAHFWGQAVATLLLGTGSYFIVEKPFLSLRERFSVRRQPRPVADAPSTVLAAEALLPSPSRSAGATVS